MICLQLMIPFARNKM